MCFCVNPIKLVLSSSLISISNNIFLVIFKCLNLQLLAVNVERKKKRNWSIDSISTPETTLQTRQRDQCCEWTMFNDQWVVNHTHPLLPFPLVGYDYEILKSVHRKWLFTLLHERLEWHISQESMKLFVESSLPPSRALGCPDDQSNGQV